MTKHTKIKRHKTAIHRYELSAPIKSLVRDQLLGQDDTVFDYGCGRGSDIRLLKEQGVSCNGWDPAFQPDSAKLESDVVNIGYVINVIENPAERDQALLSAWKLTKRVLVVSSLTQVYGRGKQCVEFGDGIITRLDTFQKLFGQAELRTYIQQLTGADAWPAGIGIFYVFKDESLKQSYLLNRYRRRPSVPKMRLSERRFEEHKELLEALMATICQLGRVPIENEFDRSEEITREFGSLRRAFALIKRVTDSHEWERIGDQHTQDLLVYLALSRFEKRPKFSHLDASLQRDIKSFFGSYKKACSMSDLLLFRAGDPEAIDDACREATLGKLLPTALYVHVDTISSLEPQLRIYEGCARNYVGEVEDANIVKIHRHSGKVSYLCYPDFEKNPHPALLRSFKVNLRNLEINCYDYSEAPNPPILHRKEAFVDDSHPSYSKFAKLTKQEERHGLLDNSSMIGTRNGWQNRLEESGFKLRGHRLIKAT
jgi:DNA phosphorothioation-associated putative methyltransferase